MLDRADELAPPGRPVRREATPVLAVPEDTVEMFTRSAVISILRTAQQQSAPTRVAASSS